MQADMPQVPAAPVPTGRLLQLTVAQLRVNPSNPRRLFDPEPLADLKENIRLHGVLVPLTVYRLRGQDIYEILDGQRRFQCCEDLVREGLEVTIPANVVEPPTKIAGLLYMFNIHNYRQPWELMPTALSLQVVMDDLGTTDTRELANLTGLNEKSVERCKILLSYPKQYQSLSLDPDARKRIPSNFWIEAAPVIQIVETELPEVWSRLKREGVLDNLVAKYRHGRIRSVIHFRRVVEAYEVAEAQRQEVLAAIALYVQDVDTETRQTFDHFLGGNQRVETAIRACRTFVAALTRTRLEHVLDEREELLAELRVAIDRASDLASALEGSDPPPPSDEDDLDSA